jgi:hypothetical protein
LDPNTFTQARAKEFPDKMDHSPGFDSVARETILPVHQVFGRHLAWSNERRYGGTLQLKLL